MSLEQDMRDLKNALQELTKAIRGLPPQSTTLPPREVAPPQSTTLPPREVAPPRPETTPENTPAVVPPTATAGGSVAEPVPSLTIDYAQVAKAITDTFKVDRAKTIAALAKFGAAKGPQLKVEDYAAFLKELTA